MPIDQNDRHGRTGRATSQKITATVYNTLTGFKYIGEQMTEYARRASDVLFGYEESYGYLAGEHCRDKDAVVASMLIAEAAAWYKKQGKTLYNVLDELYARYGVLFESRWIRARWSGKEGIRRDRRIMEWWTHRPSGSPRAVCKVSKCSTIGRIGRSSAGKCFEI